MAMERICKIIQGDAPGASTELNYFRFVPNSNRSVTPTDDVKKVFLQAALHADEQPGIMVLHHLLRLLIEADKNNALQAEFVVFPMVNPIGMSGLLLNQHQGRYDYVSGQNFNRHWPNFSEAIASELTDRLTANAKENVDIIRSAMADWLEKQVPFSALQKQRMMVMKEAYNADVVLDLHCDAEALLHIFTSPHSLKVMESLGQWVRADTVLTAEDSGGAPFDETWSFVWTQLAQAFPQHPIPHACHSATIEYRGALDTQDHLNKKDAEYLYGFLQAQGYIGGDRRAKKSEAAMYITSIDAVDIVRVEQSGLLAYQVELGDWVEEGQTIAELILLDGEEAFIQRLPITTQISGLVI